MMQNSTTIVLTGLVGGSTGLILVVYGLLISWKWLKFRFSPLEYTAPRMTPEEIEAAKAYAFNQAALEQARKAAQEQQTADFIKQQKEKTRRQRKKRYAIARARSKFKRYRRQIWETRKRRIKQIDRVRIERNFPPWLVTLAKRLKIERNQDNLAALRGWIRYALEYGQAELSHTLPIRPIWHALRDCEAAPFSNVRSYVFFRKLSKVLTSNGLLIPQTSNNGNLISQDAINMLYPAACGMQHAAAGGKTHISGQNGRVAQLENSASHRAKLAH